MQTKRVLSAGFAAVLPSAPAAHSEDAPGWFVRICKAHTQARAVKLEIGLGGNSDSHRFWIDWTSSDEQQLNLPGDLRNVQEIWIKGTADPNDRNVHMCAGYQGYITQRMTFDDSEEHETSQGDSDDCGC